MHNFSYLNLVQTTSFKWYMSHTFQHSLFTLWFLDSITVHMM